MHVELVQLRGVPLANLTKKQCRF